ncbi:MAG: hypothetical protein M0Q96_01550, partial [Candidatus Omnitrophica bacterium]|nr:hypothetical protein [Candidatus Omnitrophota bacterium]
MKNKYLIILAISLFSCAGNNLFAEESKETPTTETSVAQEGVVSTNTAVEPVDNSASAVTPSASKIDPKELKNVTALEIKGNKSISTNVVISKLKTRIGSPYQEAVVSDDLKRLYLLGFFSDIKIDALDYKDGLKVVINVVE